ncbi:NAD-glutamate dehydrogenase domain-containing protein [Croceicoccus naphthovorans]|uniref:NAD-glutamate dehydrogenase domain-containing protein n=1 Tax=Croceicoccus naphthovorans TaxID=1348774 RepID=UPI000AF328B3|nr:NAD-glutamate dehydrogenase domain-containing protein [Croceicoccus naphthovorans]MBB3990738.1 glutamate dehydrogenase [Croceicoccus naphthovorans]
MSNTKSKPQTAKAQASKSQIDILVHHIRESELPGDEPLPKGRRGEIAGFLIEAAEKRSGGKATIVIASAPEGRRGTRIAIINDDMPFLVDSIASTLGEFGLVADTLVHPIVPVQRDKDGTLVSIGKEREGGDCESMIYVEARRVDGAHRKQIEQALQATLADVRAAVEDWPELIATMLRDSRVITDPEGSALLDWFAGGMLTQLGHVTRMRDGSQKEVHGICRKSAEAVLADASWDRAFAWFDDRKGEALDHAPLVVKANQLSKVHRSTPLDLFLVPVLEDGEVVAISAHAGVWTSAALNTPPEDVPRMRREFGELTRRLGFDPKGHTGKAVLHAMTVLPHDLLIGLQDHAIARLATMMSGLYDMPRPRLAMVEAPLARHLFVFVWLPRDLMSTETRLRIIDLLESDSGAETLDWALQIEGGNLALLRFVLDIRKVEGSLDEQKLDAHLQTMLRGWEDAVEQELAQHEEAGRAAALAARFGNAFPVSYRADYGAAEAALDIIRMKTLAALPDDDPSLRRDARLYRLDSDPENQLRLKVYQYEGTLPLSDAVPALENFGFRVLAEIPTPLDQRRIGTVHDFVLGLDGAEDIPAILKRAADIEAAIAVVLNNRAENDLFNRLVVATGLGRGDAELLRAIYRYSRQGGLGFTVATAVSAFVGAPDITRALIALFNAMHDPAVADPDAASEKARKAIRDGLVKVNAINDDRLLRHFHAVIEAVLRTNAFSPAAEEALALKLDSAGVPGLPKPLPWREIFVYSRRVEGIHLRAGPVARGGLRWSDRRDDYRTEILGLMKAQRVKNAVIVPTGAKGGFYPKQLPDPLKDRDSWAAEGKASYEVFIRALLSVTDNIVDGKVVHPRNVRILDGEDPYFVVAADKGTASFSDIANAIAMKHDFWLGDAFASGGSNGYDHKAMGITARGAWISVQRHFLEMGVDVQSDTVKVVGCGDMSGDVFGNGMLLSKSIKLVAAFDHRHIFIDPDPDPAKSWKERERMFALPRSSWADYDEKLISKGGGVFPRTMKRIPLSKQAREALGVEDKEMEPDALISAVLKAPADLLWFGGIGTYVKATTQNHVEVGDPSNDLLRVDASELRVKVIGEGANLGITQAGRIEFALGGGRINTDFIDNSAGVDCSDNEVNIKIALEAARKAGRLSLERRNDFLAEMTDEVAAIVLEDNRLQTLALSVAEQGGSAATASQIRLIEQLEDGGDLDRKTEGLATSDVFTRRAAEGHGLTRPELAVLLSSSKLVLQHAIEHHDLPDDPAVEGTLIGSFPVEMQDKFRKYIEEHRLRREIVATELANRVINRLGIVLPFEVAEEENARLSDVAAAFVAADALFDLKALWQRIETGAMPEKARLALFDRMAGAVRGHIADLLRLDGKSVSPQAIHAELAPYVEALSKDTDRLLERAARTHSEQLREDLGGKGAPAKETAAVVHLYQLDGAIGLARLAADSGIDARTIACVFTDLGARLGIDWAQQTAAVMSPSDPWERLLVAGLSRDLQQMRLEFLRKLLRGKTAKADPKAAVESWAAKNDGTIQQFRAMVARAESAVPVSPSMLALIAGQARGLFGA